MLETPEALIELKGVYSGNPFALHPRLRAVWPQPLGQHAEEDTTTDLAIGLQSDPCRNHVYLVQCEYGIIGITGFFQPTADKTVLGLRWHGIIPEYRGRRYSGAAIKEVCWMAAFYQREATAIVEYVPLADAENGHFLIAHFERCGFVPDGAAKDVSQFPHGLSLPANSGNWIAMRRSLAVERAAVSGVVEQADQDAAVDAIISAIAAQRGLA